MIFGNRVYKKPQVKHWKTGPDPDLHQLYTRYRKKKAQANFRNEGWAITFRQFFEITKHCLRDHYRLSRIDKKKPWSVENIEIKIYEKNQL